MLGPLFHTTYNSQDILGGYRLSPHFTDEETGSTLPPTSAFILSIFKEYFQFSYKHMSMFYYSLARRGKVSSHPKDHPGRNILGKVDGTNHR